MQFDFSNNPTLVVMPDQICSDLNGEVVILNFKSGVYYGLNEPGTFVWNQLQEPKTFEELRSRFLEEYDVDATIGDRDLQTLLQDLAQYRLIEVTDAHRTTALHSA
jgi:hypothetical protein